MAFRSKCGFFERCRSQARNLIPTINIYLLKLKKFNKLDHPAKPRWPLDKDAAFLKGAGVKL